MGDRKITLQLITGCVVASALYACTFEITGEHFTEVPDEPTTKLVYELTEMEDSLLLLDPASLKYLFNVQGGRLYFVEAFVDGYEIYASYSSSGSITIDPFDDRYGNSGYHRFRVNVYTSTGTGSLADQVGGEAVVYSLERVVEFDRHEATDLPFSVYEKNGGLEISFGEYPHKNLTHVFLYSSEKASDLYTYANRFPVIRDISVPLEIADYIGGDVYFGIEVFARAFEHSESKHTAEPVLVNFSPVPAITSLEVLANNSAIVRWNATPYTAGFDSYTVSYTTYEGLDEVQVAENFDDIATTEHVLDRLPFGSGSHIVLTTKSRQGKMKSSDTTLIIGEPSPQFSRMVLDSDDPSLMLMVDDQDNTATLYKNQVEQSTLVNGPDDLYLFSRHELVIGESGSTLYYYRLDNLNLIKEVNIADIDVFLARLGVWSLYALSADELFIFNRFTSLVNTASMTIIDDGLAAFQVVHLPESSKVVALGNFVVDNYLSMYPFSSGALGERELHIRVDGSALSEVGDHILLAGADKVEVRSKVDLEVVNSYGLHGASIVNYDPLSGCWLLRLNNSLMVMDAATGQERLRIPAAGGGYRLYNKTIYKSTGIKLPLTY